MNLDIDFWELFVTWGPKVGWVLGVMLGGVLVGFIGARILRRLVERWTAPLGAGRSSMLGRVVSTALFVLAVVWALNIAGLPLSGVLGWVAGAAGILGVAVGFASQTSASNIISGLFLLGERPFEEGDFVRIADVSGQVLAVELLSVKLRTYDNLYVRVPNETAMKAVIVNLSRFPIRRIDLGLRFAPTASLHQVKTTMLDCATTQPYILTNPPPVVMFTTVVDGAVELQLSAWTSGEGFVDSRGKWAIALIAALNQADLPLVGPSRVIFDAPQLDAVPGESPEPAETSTAEPAAPSSTVDPEGSEEADAASR